MWLCCRCIEASRRNNGNRVRLLPTGKTPISTAFSSQKKPSRSLLLRINPCEQRQRLLITRMSLVAVSLVPALSGSLLKTTLNLKKAANRPRTASESAAVAIRILALPKPVPMGDPPACLPSFVATMLMGSCGLKLCTQNDSSNACKTEQSSLNRKVLAVFCTVAKSTASTSSSLVHLVHYMSGDTCDAPAD